MHKSDTSPDIQHVYDQKILELSEASRFLRGIELTRLSREMCRQGIRDAHPELNPEALKRAFFERIYGELFSPKEKQRIFLLL